MTGDMADDFNALRAGLRGESVTKRARNRESSPQVLDRLGVRYETHNSGVHLIVRVEGQPVVDFWPGTGKWIARDERKSSGRGVFRLVQWLGVKG